MPISQAQVADTLLAADARLRDYQLSAVEHISRHPRAGLFLEMGL